jgi:hypothetical protein
MDLKTLERLTVLKLRDEALKLPDVSGVRGMNKDELIRTLARAHGVDLSQSRRGGGEKAGLKKQIAGLKTQIAEAISSKRASDVKRLRRRVKHLKAQTRRLAKLKPVAAAASAPAASPAPAAS